MSLRSNVKKDLLPGDRPHGLCINPFLPLLSTITVYENYYAGSIAHTVKNFSLVSDILWATMSFLPTRHAVLHSLHTVCWRLPLDQRLWTVFENSFFLHIFLWNSVFTILMWILSTPFKPQFKRNISRIFCFDVRPQYCDNERMNWLSGLGHWYVLMMDQIKSHFIRKVQWRQWRHCHYTPRCGGILRLKKNRAKRGHLVFSGQC